ncbi:MAG: hypothetical protein K1X72_09390 [Pyrinomonadaceae bacterium]|nr:hypothetical protein [Pyrinomonadaceae bacterium]
MDNKLNSAIKFLVIILCVTTFVWTANAQKKKPATTKKTTTTAPATTTLNTAEIKAGADKVSIQIKNVSKFVYLLGGIARTIEDLDKEAKTRKISQTAIDANNKNKQAVIQGIQNIRAGLVALEIEFRTKPALRNYQFQISGISDLAANAEDQAANGQITESGKTLLLVIEKLSDTLVALP